MITNETDFNRNLALLSETLTLSPVDLSERMNASQMNETEQDIYEALNILYERTRILEDIKDYIRNYILRTIQNKKETYKTILSSIEKNADIYTTDKKTAVVAPFEWSSDVAIDRDGTPLSSLIHESERIYPKGNAAYRADISKMNHECHDVPFRIEKSEDGYYHAEYIKNKPDFIDNTIVVLFKEPKLINYIAGDFYNATTLVSYLTKDNDIVPIKANQYMEPVMAYGLTIECIADTYDIVTQNVDNKRSARDAFSTFKNTAVSLSDTESETASNLQEKYFNADLIDYARKVDSL